MSHSFSHHHSPYAAPRQAARWPWAIGALILVAFVAAGGLMLREGTFAVAGVNLGGNGDDPAPTVPALAAQDDAPTVDTPVLVVTAPPAPTATIVPTAAPPQDPAVPPTLAPGGTAPDPSTSTASLSAAELLGDPDPASLGATADQIAVARQPVGQAGAEAASPAENGADAPAGPATGDAPVPAGEAIPEPPQDAAPARQAAGQDTGEDVAPTAAQNAAQLPAAAQDPAASPAPATTSAVATIEDWGRRWGSGDYRGLYELLTADAKKAITEDEFLTKYQAITERAALTKLTLTVLGDATLRSEVPVHVVFESERFGTFEEDNLIPVAREGDAWKIGWIPGVFFRDLGEDGCVDLAAETPKRGAILDRDGDPLAMDGTLAQVSIIPGEIEDERAVLRQVAELTEMDEDDVKARYEDQPETWAIPIKAFPESKRQDLMNAFADVPGVTVNSKTARVYPLGEKAAHITGYISTVNAEDIERDPLLTPDSLIGRDGVEQGAEELLTGSPSVELQAVSCDTRAARETIAESKGKAPQDVVLTVDADFQAAVFDILGAVAVDGVKDPKGSTVILDPRTGAVLAMASRPSYNPNDFVFGLNQREFDRVYDDKLTPLLNRAASQALPTGSIFKVITTAAAMAHLGMDANTVIPCPSRFSLPDLPDGGWNDWTVESGLGAQGDLYLPDALVQSCNTVFYNLGYQLDEKDDRLLPDMAKAFGLGAPTNIPYFPEVGGVVPDSEYKLNVIGDFWATGDAINLSIGQGFLTATPLQMAVAYAAIANGGNLLEPFIVEFTQDANEKRTRVGEEKVRSELPLDRTEIATIQAALRKQTSNDYQVGSARVFFDFAFPIAGKTGTAQDERDKDHPHSWFAAYGPEAEGETPTIASIVLIENSGEGVAFAAPATRQIYELYLASDLER